MSVFALRLPDDLKEQAAELAAREGVSLNQFIATAVASRIGALSEAQRYFAKRGSRAVPGRAREILSRAGVGNPPDPEDRIED